jgi:5,5'-dehydrodivanillate O-demethylase
MRARTEQDTTRGLISQLEGLDYREEQFGIRRTQLHKGGYSDIDLLVFPGTMRIYNSLSIKVPIDDTCTNRWHISADIMGDHAGHEPAGNGSREAVQYGHDWETGKTPLDGVYPDATYSMNKRQFQDLMAMETQGQIAAREKEHLATADRGVVLLREILKREIERVQQGLDPMGVIRDPDHPPIGTYVEVYRERIKKFRPETQGVSVR